MPQNCNLEGNMMINLWIGGYCPTFSPFPFFGGFKHRSIGGQHPIYIRVILEIKKNMLGRVFGITFFFSDLLSLNSSHVTAVSHGPSPLRRPDQPCSAQPRVIGKNCQLLGVGLYRLCLWFGNLWNPLESQHWREYHYAIVSWIQSTNPN